MDRRTLLWTGGLGALAIGVAGGVSWLVPRSERRPGRGFASLAPAITETAFAIGGGDQLVARTPWCSIPAEAAALPTVGSGLTPDFEALAALGPARVLVDNGARAQVDAITRIAEVELFPWLTVDEVLASVARLGALFDRRDAANDLSRRLGQSLRPASEAGPTAAVLLAGPEIERGGPYWFLKGGSLHGTAIRAAGFRHAIDPDWTGEPRISAEGLIAADPDVLVVMSAAPAGSADRPALLEPLARLPLGRVAAGGGIHLLEGAELLSIGPSIVTFVDAMRRLR